MKEFDIKNDEALQEKIEVFQREWTQIVQESRLSLEEQLEQELPEKSKQKINFLLKETITLSRNENKYLNALIVQKLQEYEGLTLDSIDTNSPIYQAFEENLYMTNNPRFIQQQKELSKLGPIGAEAMAGLFSGMRGGGAAAPSQKDEKVGETKMEEKKTSFTVELVQVDPAQKIKVIKEVRSLLNLGLKEAKDSVEKLPFTLKENIKKEEADSLEEKLKSIGCTIVIK